MYDEIQALMDHAVENKVSCGMSLAVVVDNGTTRFKRNYFSGYCETIRKDRLIDDKTVFDLASLTKPLVTVLAVAGLVEKGFFTINSNISQLLSGYPMRPETAQIQLWQLLAHCSGLPAHRPYFVEMLKMKKEQRGNWLVETILSEPHHYKTGRKHVYSDLGFMLLGKIVERWSGKRLDHYFREKIAAELNLTEELYFSPGEAITGDKSFAVTEVCPWTHRWLAGRVHDDNCRVLGGVAGHAGLFGTLDGVAGLCAILNAIWANRASSRIISGKMLRYLLRRVNGSGWCCGFDSPSEHGSSAGTYFSKQSVGHLGFTGTSFWMDLQRGISIVLLTNRVYPSRKNELIRTFRPQLHDTVMKKILVAAV